MGRENNAENSMVEVTVDRMNQRKSQLASQLDHKVPEDVRRECVEDALRELLARRNSKTGKTWYNPETCEIEAKVFYGQDPLRRAIRNVDNYKRGVEYTSMSLSDVGATIPDESCVLSQLVEDQELLRVALSCLTAAQYCIIMASMDGYSPSQIAEVLRSQGVQAPTTAAGIRGAYRAAIQRMRRELIQKGWA